MDQVGFLSWAVHEDWVQGLFRTLSSRTAPGFSRVSMAQIMRADKELFVLLAQEITEPVRVEQDGTSADQIFRALTRDPRILVFMTPLPSTRAIHEDLAADVPKSKKRASDDTDKAEKPDKKPKKEADPKKPPPKTPSELAGYDATYQGKYMCWNYNLKKGCSQKVQKGRCRFGTHICMNCHRPGHGAHECRAS